MHEATPATTRPDVRRGEYLETVRREYDLRLKRQGQERIKNKCEQERFCPDATQCDKLFHIEPVPPQEPCTVNPKHKGHKVGLVDNQTQQKTVYCQHCWAEMRAQLKSLPKPAGRRQTRQKGRKTAISNRQLAKANGPEVRHQITRKPETQGSITGVSPDQRIGTLPPTGLAT